MNAPLQVQSIMTRDVLTVMPETHVCDAIDLLVTHGISGLPVIDDHRHIKGMITEEELIHLLLENLITETQTVKRFMKENVATCSPKDSVISVCEIFLKNPVVNLPVVEDGKLVGVISRCDILKLIPSKRNK